MGFEEFLDLNEEKGEENGEVLEESENSEKIGQTQFYGIITSNKPDWQTVIYDLIHSEQLDPWDIDIVVLTKKYFEKINKMEDEMDFYVSSKVLLAASLLLRIKSEFLLNRSVKSIDDVLFGKKLENPVVVERIVIDEDELPVLIPKTPLPRARRVTLSELMSALNKAINTESRRIKREVSFKRAKKISEMNLPEFRRIDLKDRIKQFYAKVLTSIKGRTVKGLGNRDERGGNRVNYCDLIGNGREEKIACFLPLLHLSNNKKLWLEQEKHLEEIWVYLHKYYESNPEMFFNEFEEELEDLGEIVENIEGEKLSGLDKARIKGEKKKKLADEIAKELGEEFGVEVDREEKIDEVSGFENEEM